VFADGAEGEAASRRQSGGRGRLREGLENGGACRTDQAGEIAGSGGRLVTVEDHWPEGGVGETVLGALAQAGSAPSKYRMLAVRNMPHSGKPDELVEAFGISARHIVQAVKEIA